MANIVVTNPMVGDTVGTLLTGDAGFYAILYNGTTAGHACELTDTAGNVVCRLQTSIGNGSATFTPAKRYSCIGLKISVITSGKVYIYS